MEISSSDEIIALPITTEGATNRYITQYEKYFRGFDRQEMLKLKDKAEAKILILRHHAPVFFETKLPMIINQACTALLACDTSVESGRAKFHELHRNFLQILDELRKTQPAGEVSFQKELDRTRERDRLRKEHVALRREIDELEATEFDSECLGEENEESDYLKTFEKLDRLKEELKIVVHRLALMDGEELEVEEEFELKIPKLSILERMSKSQQELLEDQLSDHLKKCKSKKDSFLDKEQIAQIVRNLQLDPKIFTKEEITEVNKEALEAFRKHFRDLENKRREEYHKNLVENKHLKPKEGLLLEDPDDIPEEVKEKLASNEIVGKRKLAAREEQWEKSQKGLIEAVQSDDSADDEEDSDQEDFLKQQLERDSMVWKRVKEEPRDDPFIPELQNVNQLDDEVVAEDSPTTTVLGVVEPTKKITVIEISDDEE